MFGCDCGAMGGCIPPPPPAPCAGCNGASDSVLKGAAPGLIPMLGALAYPIRGEGCGVLLTNPPGVDATLLSPGVVLRAGVCALAGRFDDDAEGPTSPSHRNLPRRNCPL